MDRNGPSGFSGLFSPFQSGRRGRLGAGDRERPAAINQIAQTTPRAVVGRHTLGELLSETGTITENIREILDVQTEHRGIEITVVELKDIQLPESMKRAIDRPPDRGRAREAREIIAAHGEVLAAGELAAAPATPPAAQAATGEPVRP